MGPLFGIPLAMELTHRCEEESVFQESCGVEGVLIRRKNLNPMSLLPALCDLPEVPNRVLLLHLQGYRLLLLCSYGFRA